LASDFDFATFVLSPDVGVGGRGCPDFCSVKVTSFAAVFAMRQQRGRNSFLVLAQFVVGRLAPPSRNVSFVLRALVRARRCARARLPFCARSAASAVGKRLVPSRSRASLGTGPSSESPTIRRTHARAARVGERETSACVDADEGPTPARAPHPESSMEQVAGDSGVGSETKLPGCSLKATGLYPASRSAPPRAGCVLSDVRVGLREAAWEQSARLSPR
jgi:hypothetical protein